MRLLVVGMLMYWRCCSDAPPTLRVHRGGWEYGGDLGAPRAEAGTLELLMPAKANLDAANGGGLTPLAVALMSYSTCSTARLKLSLKGLR